MEVINGIDGRVLARIIRDDLPPPNGVQFFSDNEDQLQLGVMRWPAGYVLAPHRHNPPHRTVKPAEVLFVLYGVVRADIYDDHVEPDLSLRRSIVLRKGDVIVLLDGGHGFEMLEESVIWEVKTGPYLPTDKTWMVGPSKHSPSAPTTGSATPSPASTTG